MTQINTYELNFYCATMAS